MSTNNGGPAFPIEHYTQSRYESTGMTLRDYFAAKAMQGIIAGILADGSRFDATKAGSRIADHAYETADAMLAKRERT